MEFSGVADTSAVLKPQMEVCPIQCFISNTQYNALLVHCYMSTLLNEYSLRELGENRVKSTNTELNLCYCGRKTAV